MSASQSTCSSDGPDEYSDDEIGPKRTTRKKTHKKSRRYRHSAIPAAAHHAYYAYPHPTPPVVKYQRIEELQQTLMQQIEYFEQERIKQKQKKRKRKQRVSAAITIQRWWRRTSNVQQWKDPLGKPAFQRLLLNDEMANIILSTLIDDYLRCDFIPNLLIELFDHTNSEEFESKDTLAKLAWYFYEEIELKICRQLSTVVCHFTIDESVRRYFDANENRLELKAILLLIANEMIDAMVAQFTRTMVTQAIEELVSAYLNDSKAVQMYEEILPVVIVESIDDILVHCVLEEEVVFPMLNALIIDTVKAECSEYKQRETEEKTCTEYETIENCLIRHVLGREMLRLSMKKLCSRGQSQSVDQQSIKLLLDAEFGKMLIVKHMRVYQARKQTKENVVLGDTLMQLLCDTAIDHFIRSLQ